LSYLIITTVVISFIASGGCQPDLPVITLKPIEQTPPAAKYDPNAIQVGPFKTNAYEYQSYGDYIQEYLRHTLAERAQADQTELTSQTVRPQPTIMLTGEVNISNIHPSQATLTSRVENGVNAGIKNPVKVETSFHLTNKINGGSIQSVILSKTAAQNSPILIRPILVNAADIFLSEIFPSRPPITVRMANGRTKYDRQGRNLAVSGDLNGALKLFRQALDNRPNNHATLYNAGLICEALGRHDQARRYYLRAHGLADKPEYKRAFDRINQRTIDQ